MMSLMASTHWGTNNLEKRPRGKVRNLDGGGDMDVFVSVSVGPRAETLIHVSVGVH